MVMRQSKLCFKTEKQQIFHFFYIYILGEMVQQPIWHNARLYEEEKFNCK